MTICEPKICERGGGGILLPLFGDGEQDWPRGLRVVLYLVGLLWCFLGVGIVSDAFMCAIEKITASKKRVFSHESMKHVTVKVWNDTVANLTLMALGSSAPEILLNVIETVGGEFYSGDLGASTIVGSAAFNLLVISAVCVMAIPAGETRRINDLNVFAVTATFSLFAYIWLLLVVAIITPDVVDIWEGLVTFFLFPLLIVLAYAADKGWISFMGPAASPKPKFIDINDEELDMEQLAAVHASLMMHRDKSMSIQEVVARMEQEIAEQPSRACRRVGAMRQLMSVKKRPTAKVVPVPGSEVLPFRDTIEELMVKPVVFAFSSALHVAQESVGSVTVTVLREGDLTRSAAVSYRTRDGSARAGTDYKDTQGKLEFAGGETSKPVTVEIVDDAGFEDDEEFFIDLFSPRCAEGATASIGSPAVATICLVDDDGPGKLAFAEEEVSVAQGTKEKELKLKVLRRCGKKGLISFKYVTEGDSAVAGRDFEEISDGLVTMKDGQDSAEICLTVMPAGHYESKETFRVILSDITGAATFWEKGDGGKDSSICTVTIEPSAEMNHHLDMVIKMMRLNWDKTATGHKNYKEQFLGALHVQSEDGAASVYDWVMHILTLPWKLLFATIPPPDFFGGWLCFWVALLFIGGVTAIIGDMAGLLGCTMEIPGSITAITFVALGTSLPDTFASKTAAVQDPYADASIGNVTGSNSVNVFLGLGFPWMISSIYWATKSAPEAKWIQKYPEVFKNHPAGNKFVVVSGALGFSVAVFASCAVTCIGLLMIRRRYFGGELGGKPVPKITSSVLLVSLWFLYVGLSSWKAIDSKGPCD